MGRRVSSPVLTGVGLLPQVRYDAARKAVEDDPNFVIGVKIRLTADIANEGLGRGGKTSQSPNLFTHPWSTGKSEAPAFEIAQRAARDSGSFLMAHHAISTVGLEECPGAMHKGDIYTHMYHGWPSTILEVER